MSDEIIKVLDALCDKLGIAVDWTSENVVPYLKLLIGKYIKYEIATSFAWIVLMALLMAPLIYVTIKAWKIYAHYYDSHDDFFLDEDEVYIAAILLTVATAIIGLIAFCVFGYQVMDIVTAFTFPEKIILNELKSMLG